MLFLICLLCTMACVAKSRHFAGTHSVGQKSFHSPFLRQPAVVGQHITSLVPHGDHVDAHVHTNAVDGFGNVHTQHENIPVGGGGGFGAGLFNPGFNGFNSGFNGFNNGFNTGYNMFGRSGGFGSFGFNGGLYAGARRHRSHFKKRSVILPAAR